MHKLHPLSPDDSSIQEEIDAFLLSQKRPAKIDPAEEIRVVLSDLNQMMENADKTAESKDVSPLELQISKTELRWAAWCTTLSGMHPFLEMLDENAAASLLRMRTGIFMLDFYALCYRFLLTDYVIVYLSRI